MNQKERDEAVVVSKGDIEDDSARIRELTAALSEMVNLHSGEDYKAGRRPMCPICAKAVRVLNPNP